MGMLPPQAYSYQFTDIFTYNPFKYIDKLYQKNSFENSLYLYCNLEGVGSLIRLFFGFFWLVVFWIIVSIYNNLVVKVCRSDGLGIDT